MLHNDFIFKKCWFKRSQFHVSVIMCQHDSCQREKIKWECSLGPFVSGSGLSVHSTRNTAMLWDKSVWHAHITWVDIIRTQGCVFISTCATSSDPSVTHSVCFHFERKGAVASLAPSLSLRAVSVCEWGGLWRLVRGETKTQWAHTLQWQESLQSQRNLHEGIATWLKETLRRLPVWGSSMAGENASRPKCTRNEPCCFRKCGILWTVRLIFLKYNFVGETSKLMNQFLWLAENIFLSLTCLSLPGCKLHTLTHYHYCHSPSGCVKGGYRDAAGEITETSVLFSHPDSVSEVNLQQPLNWHKHSEWELKSSPKPLPARLSSPVASRGDRLLL